MTNLRLVDETDDLTRFTRFYRNLPADWGPEQFAPAILEELGCAFARINIGEHDKHMQHGLVKAAALCLELRDRLAGRVDA